MSAKLFVGNLSYDTTSDEIRALFSEFGPIESCNLIMDRGTGRSRGYAFVEMPSQELALSVKKKFNGQEFKGQILRIR